MTILRMPRAKRLLLLAAVLAACKPIEDLQLMPPPTVAFLGAVSFGDGELSGSTGLVRWEVESGLPLYLEGDGPHLLLGFTEADLAGVEAPFASLEAEPLRLSAPCETALPAPIWTTTLEAGERVESTQPPPSLTTAWLSERCRPVGNTPLVIENLCSELTCPNLPTQIEGCTATIDLSDCGGPSALPLRTDADGAYCTPNEGEACRFIPHADDVDAPFVQQRVALLAIDEPYHVDNPVPRPDWLTSGYVLDLAALEDRMVAVTTDVPAGACSNGFDAPRQFRFVDQETATLTATVDAPRCVEGLFDLDGDRFLAPYDLAGEWTLGTFDRSGAMVDTTSIAGGAPILVAERRLIRLAGRADRLVILFGGSSLLDVEGGVLLLLDAPTGQVQRRWDFEGPGQTTSLRLSPDGSQAWIGTGSERGLFSINLETGTRNDHPITAPGFDGSVMDVAFPDANTIYTLVRDVVQIDRGPNNELRPAWYPGASLTQLEPWPVGSGRILVANYLAVASDERRPSRVSFFDPTIDRFLPGSWEVGDSIVGAMTIDPRGRLWLMLPGSAELVRLEPVRDP